MPGKIFIDTNIVIYALGGLSVQPLEHKIALITELQSSPAFEDEKIDLIVRRRHAQFEMPIYAVARKEGLRL